MEGWKSVLSFLTEHERIFTSVGIGFIFLVLIFAFLLGLKTSWKGSLAIAISIYVGFIFSLILVIILNKTFSHLIIRKIFPENANNNEKYQEAFESLNSIFIGIVYPLFAILISFIFFIIGLIISAILNSRDKSKRLKEAYLSGGQIIRKKSFLIRLISGFGLTIAFLPSAALVSNAATLYTKNESLNGFINFGTSIATFGQGTSISDASKALITLNEIAESTNDESYNEFKNQSSNKNESEKETTSNQNDGTSNTSTNTTDNNAGSNSDTNTTTTENGSTNENSSGATIAETYPILANRDESILRSLFIIKRLLDSNPDQKLINAFVENINVVASVMYPQYKDEIFSDSKLDQAIDFLERYEENMEEVLNDPNFSTEAASYKEIVDFVKYEIIQDKPEASKTLSKLFDGVVKSLENRSSESSRPVNTEKIKQIQSLLMNILTK
ncbi:hypothetical protein [Mycoplasmopsis glycophila]|uniref:Transmembrane protein n=1 Tax=Mycoplasmopsis glycophila TaxID=171285 RepID=A0A449AUB1_9BACT|nr:hypothetical protein [Mycoplasmopsis glycophila]VEU70072.1 Uncharacterised protein [Mycoplasmopsis glycophila]